MQHGEKNNAMKNILCPLKYRFFSYRKKRSKKNIYIYSKRMGIQRIFNNSAFKITIVDFKRSEEEISL